MGKGVLLLGDVVATHFWLNKEGAVLDERSAYCCLGLRLPCQRRGLLAVDMEDVVLLVVQEQLRLVLRLVGLKGRLSASLSSGRQRLALPAITRG